MYKLFDLYFEFFYVKKHIEIDYLPIYFLKQITARGGMQRKKKNLRPELLI
jgi:hypothetical protein